MLYHFPVATLIRTHAPILTAGLSYKIKVNCKLKDLLCAKLEYDVAVIFLPLSQRQDVNVVRNVANVGVVHGTAVISGIVVAWATPGRDTVPIVF
jgi:hypothetical protein